MMCYKTEHGLIRLDEKKSRLTFLQNLRRTHLMYDKAAPCPPPPPVNPANNF